LTKFQADAELREAERKQARADLQRQHDDQQGAAARNSETWHTWADARADARILAHMQRDGLIHEPVGAALGEYTHKVAGDLGHDRGLARTRPNINHDPGPVWLLRKMRVGTLGYSAQELTLINVSSAINVS
jgi:hypothetical protein